MYNQTNNTAIRFITKSYTFLNENIFSDRNQAGQAIETQKPYLRGIDEEADYAYILFREENKVRVYVLKLDGEFENKQEVEPTKELLYYADTTKPNLVLVCPVA